MNEEKTILVTGATGYIGGRLVPKLLESGFQVRVLVRDMGRIQGRSWQSNVEVFEGDVLQPDTLIPAMQGVDAAYYMIHSMMDSPDFHQRDLDAARNFGQAAKNANIEHIIYLGGLGEPDSDLSKHLRSRQQTGDALRESGVPVTEFRAAIIVGSGSVSFEMIRYLTERLPVMICPQWVYTKVQPISIRNVLEYLVFALETPESKGRIIEIGGKDVLTYGDMMQQYAEVRGLMRWLLPVPVLTPRLSSHWVHWITPIPKEIASPLIEGLRNEVILRNDIASQIFPQIQPMDYRNAVKLALDRLEAGQIESRWSDSLASSQGDVPNVVLATKEGMIIERRQKLVASNPGAIYNAFTSLGGEQGWLYMDWAWQLRGLIDRVFGGVGLRRGRRDPREVRVGDAVDFWRVESIENPKMLRLRAEMKVPGDAWLQFEVLPQGHKKSLLAQTAFFAPKGLAGLLYWYLLYPIHSLVFSGMINKLGERSLMGFELDQRNDFGDSSQFERPIPVAIPIDKERRTK
ncbi:MAG: SDR family oxidoreductase [Chloroflexota bacterium]|nr:MAG: SDR family oxidoreductase [Chloroflexota bacterium]